MTTTPDQIARLFFEQLSGELSAPDAELLAAWIAASPAHAAFAQELEEDMALGQLVLQEERDERMGVGKYLLERTKQQLVFSSPAVVRELSWRQQGWVRYAAALLLLVAGVVAYYHFTARTEKPLISSTISPHSTDIAPGGQRAVLTLANGSTIVLDSVANGRLAEQSGSVVTKENGQVVYIVGAGTKADVAYNTMTTPQGGQYQLRLPDGSKVWLNAASSIRYPTVFAGKERSVTVSGEAYFEIATNPNQPFVVHTPMDVIEVLGTSFNVNAYPDEPAMKTTLVTGAVKVNQTVLRPGEAFVQGKVTQADVAAVTAWKNGLFNFTDTDLPAMMRQLSRWYGITVRYEGAVPAFDYKGKLPMNLTLSQVLGVLDQIGIHYRLENKTLIVSP